MFFLNPQVAELHQQLQRYIAGQDGAGGLREYSGSDGSFRPPRVGKVDQGLALERQLLSKVEAQVTTPSRTFSVASLCLVALCCPISGPLSISTGCQSCTSTLHTQDRNRSHPAFPAWLLSEGSKLLRLGVRSCASTRTT